MGPRQPHTNTEIGKETCTHTHTYPISPHVNGQAHTHKHETKSGTEGDKQQKPEEENDCFRHMWQESTRRIIEGGEKWQSCESDRHAGQSHRCTDGQNDRETERQAH